MVDIGGADPYRDVLDVLQYRPGLPVGGGADRNRGGEKITRFACVDGPDFDGYEVDFDEAMSRGRMYMDFEKASREETCNLFRKA